MKELIERLIKRENVIENPSLADSEKELDSLVEFIQQNPTQENVNAGLYYMKQLISYWDFRGIGLVCSLSNNRKDKLIDIAKSMPDFVYDDDITDYFGGLADIAHILRKDEIVLNFRDVMETWYRSNKKDSK